MKKLLLIAAAAATAASIGFAAAPASAQVVIKEGRHGGVAVRLGDNHRGYHRGPRCRTVTERTRVGHRVIVKTRRVCR
jgi:hypothetical protein